MGNLNALIIQYKSIKAIPEYRHISTVAMNGKTLVTGAIYIVFGSTEIVMTEMVPTDKLTLRCGCSAGIKSSISHLSSMALSHLSLR